MHIEELGDEVSGGGEEESIVVAYVGGIGFLDAKRAMVGVGARVLFYPTLMYNVIRNKIQSEFRWWDEVDEFLLLGAVPFPSDVPRLKQLGVHGVITLNESYETLVPTSLYFAHGIEHLVIPTRDYLFAPSFGNIRLAVDFIHRNASCGKTTYIHCKAGRGRSTTIVLCYLMQHRQMTPNAAYEYVRVRRPRVLLASSQWQAVQEYYYHLSGEEMDNPAVESSFVLVSHSDIDGFSDADMGGNGIMSELRLMYRWQFAREAALARLSCLWIQCHAHSRPFGKMMR